MSRAYTAACDPVSGGDLVLAGEGTRAFHDNSLSRSSDQDFVCSDGTHEFAGEDQKQQDDFERELHVATL
jgi:hypothetical protein